MKTRRIFQLGLLAVLAVSCVAEQRESAQLVAGDGELVAGIENTGTRVSVDEALQVLWDTGDCISVFRQTMENRTYQLKGEGGVASGVFKAVGTPSPDLSTKLSLIYAVYPADDAVTIDEDGVLALTLPAEQTYAADGFGPGANTMVAVSEDKNLSFKNLCGYVAVQLLGDVKVNSITLRSNAGEPLAGAAWVTAEPEKDPVLDWDEEEGVDAVTLTCEEPVELSLEEPTVFWIVVPPAEYVEGFTLEVNYDGEEGEGVFEKEGSESQTVVRNTLNTMAPLTIKIHKELQLKKVFGLYGKSGVGGWPAFVQGIEDLDGNIRSACFDDEFVYIPKTAGIDADKDGSFDEVKIFTFKVKDGSYAGLVQRTTDPDYMAGTWASTHPVSCARMMKNNNNNLNGGKDILVVCNLIDAQNLRIYAWENGIDKQPRLLTNFSNGRRLGDKMSLEGTYQNGRLWFRSGFDTGSMVCYVNLNESYQNGFNGSHAWNWVEGLGSIPAEDPDGISEYYDFGSKGKYGLIASNTGKPLHLVGGTEVVKNYPALKRCFGWNAFSFEGKDYLAFLNMGNGTDKPVVTVLEGASNTIEALQETLDNYKVVVQASCASEDQTNLEANTAYATNNVGDCQVRFIDDVPYVLGVTRGGMAMFQLVWE